MRTIIIVLLLMFSSSCNSEQTDVLEYVPIRNETDRNIRTLQILPVDTILIEENEDVIIRDISSAAVSQDKRFLALSSPGSRQLLIYDYDSGKLVKELYSGTYLSDSVALSGKKPSEGSYSAEWSGFDWNYITVKELDKNGQTISDTSKLIKNMFAEVHFFKNKLFSSAIVYIPAINGLEDQHVRLTNLTVLLSYDEKFEIERIVIPEDSDFNSGLPYEYIINDRLILTTSNSVVQYTYNIIDSLISIVEYDLKSGDKLGTVGYLPSSYIDSKIGYSMWWQPKLTEINQELFVGYPIDSCVYGKNNVVRFNFKNLPFSNNEGFRLFHEYKKIDFRQRSDLVKKDLLYKIFPVTLIRLNRMNKNLLAFFSIHDPDSIVGHYYLIQEYSKKGKLLREGKIFNDKSSQIKKILFDNSSNTLLIFRKSQNGWTIQRNEI